MATTTFAKRNSYVPMQAKDVPLGSHALLHSQTSQVRKDYFPGCQAAGDPRYVGAPPVPSVIILMTSAIDVQPDGMDAAAAMETDLGPGPTAVGMHMQRDRIGRGGMQGRA